MHTARAVRNLLEERAVLTLPWPPKGADFNIIENVWGQLKQTMSRMNLGDASADELWFAIAGEWQRLGEKNTL